MINTMLTNEEFDRRHVWHPYASITRPLPCYAVSGAQGCEIHLQSGERLIDGMSSWWAAVHGYNHPALNRAVAEQLEKMSHVMFGGLTHEPAIELCRRLVGIAPKGLECVFLADSGSVAVEVAMKMALQYWQGRGEPRRRFLSLAKGYHGDTFGAMSVSDPTSSMHSLYRGFLPDGLFVDGMDIPFDGEWREEAIAPFAETMARHHRELAAVVLEPIVQGAGGMRFYHPEYLRQIRRLCDDYGVLLIADEIATGFGRSGRLFACEYAEISPDILCLGKALTGGYMTLSAVMTRRSVAETISDGQAGCLMHGPTFMGNPLACAVACASLNLLTTGEWRIQVAEIEAQLKRELAPLASCEFVEQVRVLGAIGVVEMKRPVSLAKIQRFFVEQSVWIRPFGRLIYLMPPYVISPKQLTCLTQAVSKAVTDYHLYCHA
ncbi:Adenosylmethionine-8-amino-7-oxononanoate aminotransferase [Leminorella grimontii]|nr:Adenosylmethionine-8-amino-7-oxononanoate aminotransferase [Leminorella grimontii]